MPGNQERDVSRIFAKHGLRLDVPISDGRVGREKKYPFIKPSSWIATMDRRNMLHKLFGLGPDLNTLDKVKTHLLDFWSKYELGHAGHEVFDMVRQGRLRLERCVPCYIHGDEGTTLKKGGNLVLSFFSPVGQGVAGAKTGEDQTGLLMNFIGHGFSNRFVTGSLLKACVRNTFVVRR